MSVYLSVSRTVEELLEMPPFIGVNGDYERAKEMLTQAKEMHLDEWYDWWEEWCHAGNNDTVPWDMFKDKLIGVAELAGVALYVVNEDEEVVYVVFDMTRWIEKSEPYHRAKAALLDLYKYCNECTVIKTLDGDYDHAVAKAELTVHDKDGHVGVDLTMIAPVEDDSEAFNILFDRAD